MKEIEKTMNRIETIQRMKVENLVYEVVFYYETKQSKENFKTIN